MHEKTDRTGSYSPHSDKGRPIVHSRASPNTPKEQYSKDANFDKIIETLHFDSQFQQLTINSRIALSECEQVLKVNYSYKVLLLLTN